MGSDIIKIIVLNNNPFIVVFWFFACIMPQGLGELLLRPFCAILEGYPPFY